MGKLTEHERCINKLKSIKYSGGKGELYNFEAAVILLYIDDLEKKIEELEKERDGIYDDYQDLGKEYYKLIEKYED